MTEPTPAGVTAPAPDTEAPSAPPPFSESWLGRAYSHFTGAGRYQAGFLILLLAALALRMWELDGRVMHYDEAIHLFYSWRLSNFEGFVHSPWMHGPFQIEVVALLLKVVGDSDFVARLAYVLFGTALVGLPYFLRDGLGRSGALLTGVMLAVSPSLLYFSRFGRNDIIMAVLAVSLFALLWSYVNNPRNRYLYLTSALLAIAFATKESSYIITVIFGALAFLLALPYSRLPGLWPFNYPVKGNAVQEPLTDTEDTTATDTETPTTDSRPSRFRRVLSVLDLRKLNPAAGFLTLLVTLTLPLWSAGVELARAIFASLAGLIGWNWAAKFLEEGLGLNLIGSDAGSQGIVGAPLWAAPFVQLPFDQLGVWLPGAAAFLIVAACIAAGWVVSRDNWRKSAAVLIPVAVAYAAALSLTGPFGTSLDILISLLLGLACVAAFVYLGFPWRYTLFVIFVPLIATLVYCLLFLPVLKVDALLTNILPEGVQVASSGNAVPLNFLVAGGILLPTGCLAVVVGMLWKGGVWLTCAIIFGIIWVTLFTTFFTNPAGFFSGSWQGMGYWIAQQDVARGNQPWYYYLVGLSVYEFLPVIFGVVGAVVFIRRRDRFGMALAFWTSLNFLAYTVASEKMPWLLVNITVPFIFLAGKLLGELVDRVSWSDALDPAGRYRFLALLAIPVIALSGLAYSMLSLTGEQGFSYLSVGVLVTTLPLAVAGAWLVRRAGIVNGPALAALGIGALLLGFTIWTAFLAAYTYNDSRREILVYAQGSANLLDSHAELDRQYFRDRTSSTLAAPVQVDYDVWYPFQWYVRHQEKDGNLSFSCFKDQDGQDGCRSISGNGGAPAILAAAHHRAAEPGSLAGYDQYGPRRNLLWFPETYRRPGENRQSEEFVEEVKQDLLYFREAAASPEKWHQALDYLFTRNMDADWFNSEYYTYVRRESAEPGDGN